MTHGFKFLYSVERTQPQCYRTAHSLQVLCIWRDMLSSACSKHISSGLVSLFQPQVVRGTIFEDFGTSRIFNSQT